MNEIQTDRIQPFEHSIITGCRNYYQCHCFTESFLSHFRTTADHTRTKCFDEEIVLAGARRVTISIKCVCAVKCLQKYAKNSNQSELMWNASAMQIAHMNASHRIALM